MANITMSKENGIVVLGVKRPEALNALSRNVVDEMDEAIETIKNDREVRCLVIYSEKNFAAGADIKDMVECDSERARSFVFSPTYNKLSDMTIPVIAAIEGYALGGGLELALTADIRIAGEGAKMGFPEITLGIMPGAGGTIRAPKVIGEASAKELIFTGAIISAGKAEKIGLVNAVVPDGEVLEAAMKMAKRIVRNAPIAMKMAKETIKAGMEENERNIAIEIEAGNWANLFKTQDQKEGMRAFMEKRQPDFQGK